MNEWHLLLLGSPNDLLFKKETWKRRNSAIAIEDCVFYIKSLDFWWFWKRNSAHGTTHQRIGYSNRFQIYFCFLQCFSLNTHTHTPSNAISPYRAWSKMETMTILNCFFQSFWIFFYSRWQIAVSYFDLCLESLFFPYLLFEFCLYVSFIVHVCAVRIRVCVCWFLLYLYI